MNIRRVSEVPVVEMQQPGEAPQFDWTDPFDILPGGEVTVASSADFDRERSFAPSPIADGDLFEEEQEDFTATATTTNPQRKRELDDMFQGAPLRRKKKPKSLPKRPLSAYNLYFQHLRADLNTEGAAKIGFHELGKIVGKKWRTLEPSEHKVYKDLAVQDSERYRREMDLHKKLEAMKKEEESSAKPPPPHQEESIPQARTTSHCAPYAGMPQNYGPPPAYGTMPPPYQNNYQGYPPQPPYVNTHNWGGVPSGPPQAHFHPPSYPSSDSLGSPALMEGEAKNGRPLPPGSEVHLRDPTTGELRSYTVQYAMVAMSRQEAKDYMERLKKTP